MESSGKTVVIVGGNFVNKGAQLMISTVISMLKECHPHLVPVVIDSFPIKERRKSCDDATVLSVPYYLCFVYAIIFRMNIMPKFIAHVVYHILRSLWQGNLVTDLRYAKKASLSIRNAAYIIDISGYGYQTSDNYMDVMNYIQIVYSRLASKWGTSYIYFPQSFGPFSKVNSKFAKKLKLQIRGCIQSASQIYCREKKSMTEISQLCSIGNWSYWPDIALLYAPKAQRIYPIDVDEKALSSSILIIPNVRLYDKYSEKVVDYFYSKLISSALDGNYNVTVLRHSDDDAAAINKIETQFSGRILILNSAFETDVIESVIASSRFVISGRYHGLVVALRNTVPCIATGWSHKYDELMGLYGLEKNLIDISRDGCVGNALRQLEEGICDWDNLSVQIGEVNSSLLLKYSVSRFLSFIDCEQDVEAEK